MDKVDLKIIKKLLKSSNEDDVILGVEFLNKRYEGRRGQVSRIVSKIEFFNSLQLEIYSATFNATIDCSFGSIHPLGIPPLHGFRLVKI